MNIFQAARTVAGCKQRIQWIAFTLTDAANIAAALRCLTAAGDESATEENENELLFNANLNGGI